MNIIIATYKFYDLSKTRYFHFHAGELSLIVYSFNSYPYTGFSYGQFIDQEVKGLEKR